jgi:PAS domain S-box-containing protein
VSIREAKDSDTPQTKAIRVLIADDAPGVRAAITELLAAEPGIELAGSALNAGEAIALAELTSPDVALVDVKMPGGGLAATRGIKECSPRTQVLALSAYDDRGVAAEMLMAGAIGYLVKGEGIEEILEAITRAGRGQASLSAELAAGVFEAIAHAQAIRRESEQALRTNEQTLLALLECAPGALVNLDASGTIVFANRQTEELFGYTRAELLGSDAEMLLPERLRGGLLADGARTQASPAETTFELAGLRKDGSEFPVEIAIAAIETPTGTVLSADFRDMTATVRRLAVAADRVSEERLTTLLDRAPDAIVIATADGHITTVNRQTETLFGYERGELIGAAIETLIPLGAGADLTGRRKDGSELAVDISLASVDSEDGRLVMSFIRDVSERRQRLQLEQEAARRRELLAHLIAAGEAERRRIATDIHDDSIQAITTAAMRVQMLRRALGDTPESPLLDELERTIQLSITHLRQLLFELLPPELDQAGLSAAMRAYVDQVADDGDTIYWLDDRLEAQPPDDTRLILYRIAQEALTNIRKHAGATTAAVRLIALDGGFSVRVLDDGIGFHCDGLASTLGHPGLAGMRERAALAGGWLRVQSCPGAGTAVECWLPAGSGAEESLQLAA